jgi:outer membrane protein assembly factor BamE (lipoprotein component of BamABCDE complex)
MTEEQQKMIKKNIANIRRGMSFDEVQMNLGDPTYIERQNTKEGKDIGWKLAYYFCKQEENAVKTTDKYLTVYVGADNKADKIATTISELRMKTWGPDFYIESMTERQQRKNAVPK